MLGSPVGASSDLHSSTAVRVLADHWGMRRVSVAAARYMVTDAAQRMAAGTSKAELLPFVERLQRETGCSIAELAVRAEGWPD